MDNGFYWVSNNHGTKPFSFAHNPSANMYTQSKQARIVRPGETLLLRTRKVSLPNRVEEVGQAPQLVRIVSGGYKSLGDTKYWWTSKMAAPYEAFQYSETFASDATMPQPYYYVHPAFIPANQHFRVTSVKVNWRCSTAISDGLHFYVAKGTHINETNPFPRPTRIA